MAIDLSETLVIGISATALFDLSIADNVFNQKRQLDPDSAMEEYRRYMLENENVPLADGTGMPLVKAMLALNNSRKPGDDKPLVEVVVVSRNSPETGYRVLKEIRQRGLNISRSAFTAGESVTHYLDAFYVDLFLTTNEDDAQRVIDTNQCAAAVMYPPPKSVEPYTDTQVRFAFDGDAVIFDDASELINQTQGLQQFHQSENEQQDVPLNPGPHANLLIKLSKIKERLPGRIEYSPIRLALITARNSPAEMRVINTLRHWGVYVDEVFFLGGLEKARFLKAFNPHIFFDDQDAHLDPAATSVPSARVLYPSHSALRTVMQMKTLTASETTVKSDVISSAEEPINKLNNVSDKK
ncbi:5'-nucleotidase [Pragia fontium]|uniref:5'-nucleotidase n=1 Tax=Pragia fontium TaxID=82985 RepID=UPI00064976C9|nr:5'-nucleotidase [Pragia fontium]AKJ42425.1 5'-nucleotidase [Pragia fontium]